MKTYSVLVGVSLLVAALALSGCAMFQKGPKPEELVMKQTQSLANDLLATNVDKILGYVSDSFTNEHVASKAEIASHIQKAKDKGKIAEYAGMIKEHDAKIDLKAAKVKVEKDTATVYPITASADVGSVTVELKFKKDPDKVWRVCAINIEGI